MPDLRRIRRYGPGPWSFSRRQHQQQKPIGSCLTFQWQFKGTDGDPQQQLQHEPQRFDATSVPQQLHHEPQCFDATSVPQQLQHEQQRFDASGVPQQLHHEPQCFDTSGDP